MSSSQQEQGQEQQPAGRYVGTLPTAQGEGDDDGEEGTTSIGVPTNADAVLSRNSTPIPGSPVGGSGRAGGTNSAGVPPNLGKMGGAVKEEPSTAAAAAAATVKEEFVSDYVPHPRPPFPEPGSTIGSGGRYFTLGKLGRGTFCSIHKCVDLGYSHALPSPYGGSNGEDEKKEKKRAKQRIVAAKVELSTFANSGVLDGEATVLKHLSRVMPEEMVPIYLNYVRDGPTKQTGSSVVAAPGAGAAAGGASSGQGAMSAIIMEYLPGEDMHHLRDRHCQAQAAAAASRAKRAKAQAEKASAKDGGGVPATIVSPHPSSGAPSAPPSPNATRRLSIADSVYLTTEIMLPLLKSMHEAGAIHRDVKPSNCVRSGTTSSDKSFKIVDFGLSKSFVVPRDSGYADTRYGWEKEWDRPPHFVPRSVTGGGKDGDEAGKTILTDGCLRKERPDAEFRGTSMYASLRVHQGRDYSRRDDVWGLLYVFCDLVSGGLPWMSYALERNRNMCRLIKEVVHGERKSVEEEEKKDDDKKKGHEEDGKGDKKDGAALTDKATDDTPLLDDIPLLLKGADYHTSKYKYDQHVKSFKAKAPPGTPIPPEELLPPIAPALHLSCDTRKVDLLREAFKHVSSLSFTDEPDYDLIGRCLKGFLDDADHEKRGGKHTDPSDADIRSIDWNHSAADAEALRRKRERRRTGGGGGGGGATNKWDLHDGEGDDDNDDAKKRTKDVPTFQVVGTDDYDPLRTDILDEADRDKQSLAEALEATAKAGAGGMSGGGGQNNPGGDSAAAAAAAAPDMSTEAADVSRLPLTLQLRLAQVEYNASHPTTVPPHLALRDWMALAQALVYGRWDAAKFERGNHRTDEDGYRREVYARLVTKSLEAAKPFGFFTRNKDCFYYPPPQRNGKDQTSGGGPVKEEDGAGGTPVDPLPKRKRRKIEITSVAGSRNGSNRGTGKATSTPRLELSRAFAGLRGVLEVEKDRKFAPPPKITFFGDSSGALVK